MLQVTEESVCLCVHQCGEHTGQGLKEKKRKDPQRPSNNLKVHTHADTHEHPHTQAQKE